jgi:hypothetical protein
MKHIECTANGTIGQAVETWSQAMKRGTRARQMAGRWNTQMEHPDRDPETQVERGFARKQVTQNGATGRSQHVAGTGDERGSWRVVAGPEAMGEAMQVGSATGRRQFVVH